MREIPRVSIVVLLVFACATACDTHVTEEASVRWTARRITADVAEARKGDPAFHCAAVRQAMVELASAHSTAANDAIRQGRDACRDLLLAYARERVATAEKARGPLVAECTDLDRAMTVLLGIVPDHAEAARLEARRRSLCQ